MQALLEAEREKEEAKAEAGALVQQSAVARGEREDKALLQQERDRLKEELEAVKQELARLPLMEVSERVALAKLVCFVILKRTGAFALSAASVSTLSTRMMLWIKFAKVISSKGGISKHSTLAIHSQSFLVSV